MADVRAAFEALKTHMDEVSAAERETVRESINLLISAVEDGSIPKSRVVAAVEAVASASESMKRALRDFSIGTAASLTASGFVEAVRLAIGAG